ncbi:MAG: amino acid ABC transporter permease [Puniceicoccales bacterium]|nr:amino acid ABC transporter permease [Puniceicoccales bacterium]
MNFVDWTFIGSGAKVTLELLFGGLSIGVPLSIILVILKRKNLGTWLINPYISIIRGTPLILQLSLIYFASPGILGIKFTVLEAGIIAFALNNSAYMAEILRAGVDSVPKGQFEAAETLKISTFYTWKDIILPQVLANILPAFTNEIITLLKETALIATIGGADIMRKSQMLAAEQFTYFAPLCIAGFLYYILAVLVEFLAKKLEKKIHHA